jgi:hypothetical protein
MYETMLQEIDRMRRIDARRAAEANRLSERARALAVPGARRSDVRAALGRGLVRAGLALLGPAEGMVEVQEAKIA